MIRRRLPPRTHAWLAIIGRDGSALRGGRVSAALPSLLRRRPGAYSGVVLDLQALAEDPRPELIAPQLWRLLSPNGRALVIGRPGARRHGKPAGRAARRTPSLARLRWLFAPWFETSVRTRARRTHPDHRIAEAIDFRRLDHPR